MGKKYIKQTVQRELQEQIKLIQAFEEYYFHGGISNFQSPFTSNLTKTAVPQK